jgi:hypothetical protein
VVAARDAIRAANLSVGKRDEKHSREKLEVEILWQELIMSRTDEQARELFERITRTLVVAEE